MSLPTQRYDEAIERLEQMESGDTFTPYRYTPIDYITKYLDWTPWGDADSGQVKILDAYTLALRQQHERYDYEQGNITADQLEYWQPDEVIKSWISVDAGHTVGKTKVAAGIVSHFFDCFPPAIVYCFAPTNEQINLLLFKEIRVDREGKQELRGEVMEVPAIKYKGNHFARGKATNNAKNAGTERTQGQHNDYMLFVLDEAEGIPSFVWDAVDSMTSSGIAHIVLVLRNPRTTTCKAHKIRKDKKVEAMRISCLEHPNVIQGKTVVAGVTRQWVNDKVDKYCTEVDEHDPDKYTFELPYRAGTIYQPHDILFLWRVLGIASANVSGNTFCPTGRYEAAQKRTEPTESLPTDKTHAGIGVDVARFGTDKGSIWGSAFGKAWRVAQLSKKDTNEYVRIIKAECIRLARLGIKHMSIRVDGGGGFGGGVVDRLIIDEDLKELFDSFEVLEVHFNGKPQYMPVSAERDNIQPKDMVTQLYFDASERLKRIALIDPPDELEIDLTERTFKVVLVKGVDKLKLEDKEKFRDLQGGRSPDDGDAFVLAVGKVKGKSRLLFA